MSDYRREQRSSTLVATPQALAQHAPATPLKSSNLRKPDTSRVFSRFKLDGHIADDYLNKVKVSPRQRTVEEEFDKYTTALVSPIETDILHFWEVSHNHINEDKWC